MARKSNDQAVLGNGLAVRGRVHGEGDLRIEGSIEGDVRVAGHLELAGQGSVTGRVEASAITVAGDLEGDVHTEGAVHIAAGGSLRGDVAAAELSLDEGGRFNGRVDAEFDLPEEIA
jgi:cytoskeletal protein CcmA (bactofilin family)